MTTPLPHFFNILVAPAETLGKLREHTRFLYPFLAVLITQALVIGFYYQAVDFDWLTEYMLSALPEDVSPQARDNMQAANSRMGPKLLAGIGVLSTVVMFSLIWSISAGYLTLASSLGGDNISFRQWFGLECWGAVPAILVAIASFVTILANSDGQLGQDKLNPFTLNNLLLHYNLNERGASLFNALDLSIIWGAAIKVNGFKVWTGSSLSFSAAIVLAPYLLIFGTWALLAFT